MAFISPIVNGFVVSGWWDDRSYRNGKHEGLDFRAPIGTPVQAVESGVVTKAKSRITSVAGKNIAIKHAGGWTSRYLHMDSLVVQVGQRVSKGQHIGNSGRTGISRSAAHLHFDLRLVKEKLAWYAAKYGKPNTGWGKNAYGGVGVPAENVIPGNYSDKVKRRAAQRGVSFVGLGVGLGLFVFGAAGVVFWVLRG